MSEHGPQWHGNRIVARWMGHSWIGVTPLSRLLRTASISLLMTVTLFAGAGSPLAQGLGSVPSARAQGQLNLSSGGAPNRFDPHADTSSTLHRPSYPQSTIAGPSGPPQPIAHGGFAPHGLGSVALDPAHSAHFASGDGRFLVDVPEGAVTAADVRAAGGALLLQVAEIAPPSGANAGGSGLVSFGTYLLQVVDAHGVLAKHGLRRPVTVRLDYGKAAGVDLQHAFVVVNGSLPGDLTTAVAATTTQPATPPTGAAPQAPDPGTITHHVVATQTPAPAPPQPVTAAGVALGPYQTQNTTLDSQHQQLVVTPLAMSNPSTTMTWNTTGPIAYFGKPDLFNANLSAGSLAASLPVDVPAGPGGLTPPIQLAYSSAGVSEDHSVQAAGGWVGEGWTLSMGAINWAEHDGTAGCVAGGTCQPVWENSWQLSDPYGTGSDLIPPNDGVSTYYDDTPNAYYNNGTYYNLPSTWHTSNESYARIVDYRNTTINFGNNVNPPCFRVWLTNGLMEEFGCTSDSLLEYVVTPNSVAQYYLNGWLLDMITDPQGNQIHFTYQRDTETQNGLQYPRDAVLSSITWDSPGCHNAQTMCTGSAWAPLMQVSFAATHAPTRLTNSPVSPCNTGTNLRCDDPQDLSGSGGLVAPAVQSTFVLNDVQVQVRGSGTGSWNLLKDYQLSYEENGPSQITDAATGKAESTAGYLDLTQITVVGDDTTTKLPTRTFTYTTVTEDYEDDAFHPNPSTNCGPSWNTGNGSGCILWSQSVDGNSRYLATTSNGMGLAQTFSWANARNNTHGVNTGGSLADPLYCNSHQTGYPCNEADDQAWSHAVLTQQSGAVVRAASGGNQTITSTMAYTYFLTTGFVGKECGDCAQGMYWGNENENDYLDYYNGKYMGFAETDVSNPDGSLVKHHYDATTGWGVYDNTQITNCAPNMQPPGPTPCPNDPWWTLTNAAHGHEVETDTYDTNGTTLLAKTTTQYQAICPPVGVSGTPAVSGYGNFNGHLVSELDLSNPVATCDIQTARTDSYTEDGSSAGGLPDATTQYTYDSYGREMEAVTSSNDGGATGSPTTLIAHVDYIWNNAISTSQTSASGTYLIDFPNLTYTRDSANSAHYGCAYTSYDGQAWSGGQQSTLTLGEPTRVDQYTGCGTPGNGFGDATGQMTTTSTYDQWGNQLTTTTPDANAGVSGHVGCMVGGTPYSVCDAYDTTFDALPTTSANAFNQSSSAGYGSQTAESTGFGLWPMSTTDANGQTTSYSYDALGRMTGQTLPGETSGDTTTSWSYTDWCQPTGAQTPCVEIDQTQRLDDLTTMTTRAFYDGYGNLVETRTPGSGGQDVVRYRNNDAAERDVFDSVPYFVSAYTGGPGSAAFATPDSTQSGTTTEYDGLGRVTQVIDPLTHSTNTSYSVVCNAPGTGDSACYERTLVADPQAHQSGTLADALGRAIYAQRYTGNSSSTYALYTTTKQAYDYLGDLTALVQPNGTSTTSYTYDQAGRMTGMNDPDRGTESYSYDQDGNLTKSVDARGTSGTVYAGYDGLDRLLWQNTSNSPTGAFASETYDSTANGNVGIGRLTGETFSGAPANTLSGSYAYTYDARGQQTGWTVTLDGTAYPTSQTFDDAGLPIQSTYPDGSTATLGYNGAGQATTLTSLLHGSQTSTYVVSGATYQPSGQLATMDVSGTPGAPLYTETFSYDSAQRLTGEQATLAGQGSPFYALALGYDASSNVTSTTTSLPAFGSNAAGTDNQSFCYDEFDRLVWAGTSGTPSGPAAGSCGPTPGGTTLKGAGYTASYTYDTLDRMTIGPAGTYTYSDASHLHAVSSTSDGHSYAYDPSGNATCQAQSSSTTCAGTPTGALLTWDVAGRLASWQNAPSSPTTTDTFLYDGSGERLELQVTSSGMTTTTRYIGSLAQYIVAKTTSWQKYYIFAGQLVADEDGSWHYLLEDQLGTPELEVNGSGGGQAGNLHGPYGAKRYSGATLLGNLGFTGQRKDQTSDLTYFNARYYDQDVGVFVSADPVNDGLNRYAYAGSNPETMIDPSGNMFYGAWDALAPQYLQDSSEGNGWGISWDAVKGLVQFFTGGVSLSHDVGTIFDPHTSIAAKFGALGDAYNQVVTDIEMPTGLGVVKRAMAALASGGGTTGTPGPGIAPGGDGDTSRCSFSAETPVATPSGEQPIGSLKVGDTVEAYDRQTGTAEAEPVQHVWVNHDPDLLDVRVAASNIRSMSSATASSATASSATAHPQASGHGLVLGDGTRGAVHLSQHPHAGNVAAASETIHTTANHPWLTSDRGWVTAGNLRPGEPVVTLNGSTTGTVLWVRVVPGQADRYNLTVAQDHTYAVGVGQWIVHNIGCLPTLTEAQKWQGINQAKNYAQTNKAKAGAVAKISGHDEVLAKGYSGEIQPTDANGVPGRFAPDAKLTVWQDAGRGNCAEFYCLSLRHRPDAPIDIFIYHERGIGPCSACIETFGKFIDNNNGWPIRAFWLDKSGIIQSQEFP